MKNYHAGATPRSNFAVLNANCSYFLLVDNGTVGRYGAEVMLRKRLEKHISEQKIDCKLASLTSALLPQRVKVDGRLPA